MAAGVRRVWLTLWLACGVHGNAYPHTLKYRSQIRARYSLRQIVLSKWRGGFLVKINWCGIIEWVGRKRFGEII